MATSNRPQPKNRDGRIKAGRNSRSGGKNAGRNSERTRNVITVSSLGIKPQTVDGQSITRVASQRSIMALREKLTTAKTASLLSVAEYMLEQRSDMQPMRLPLTGVYISAREQAANATMFHFRNRQKPLKESTIKAGVFAADEEFAYQRKLITELVTAAA